MTLDKLLERYRSPSPFQTELAVLISDLAKRAPVVSTLEMGSGFGITSALLGPGIRGAILDIDGTALRLAGRLFEALGVEIEIMEDDFFNVSGVQGRFGVVFNAGVVEHFDEAERRILLANMAELTAPGGYVVVGVPNHDCLPYRVGYRYRCRHGKWPYPKEHPVRELAIPGTQPIAVRECDVESAYRFLPRRLRWFFKACGLWCHFEKYLKVFIFRKTDT